MGCAAAHYLAKQLRNRVHLWLLRVLLAVTILLAAMSAVLPIQDYALSEYRAYLVDPSSEKLAAFHSKQRQETWVRAALTLTFGISSWMLTIPISRLRKRLRAEG